MGFGPSVAGMLFGTGWWFWVDAVVCSVVQVSVVHYLPDSRDEDKEHKDELGH